MSLPIFLVHWGNSDYLKYCLDQAKKYNPDSVIYLFGDETNNKYSFVSHHNIKDYSVRADKFEGIYKHLNSVPLFFEVFCYKRWFVINEFLEKHPEVNEFMYIDSDVLLYSDITEEFDKFKEYDITVCGERSPHCTFFKSRNSLSAFCDYMWELYTDSAMFSRLVSIYEAYAATGRDGGVDDMTVFYEYKMLNRGKVGDNSVLINKAQFEQNISYRHEYEYNERKSIKKLYMINGEPYGKLAASGELVKFSAIHFQGKGKRFMHHYYTGRRFMLNKVYSELYYTLYLPLQKIYRQISPR